MTRQEQIKFVSALSNLIARRVIDLVKNDKIPEDWDGVELRQYLSDMFAGSTHAMPTKRKRAYKNALLVNNL